MVGTVSAETVKLLTQREFVFALVLGAAAAALAGLFVFARPHRALPANAGLFLLGALLVAWIGEVPTLVLIAIGLTAAAGAIPASLRARAVLCLPGALLLALATGAATLPWIRLLVVIAVPTCAMLAPGLVAVAAVGLFFSVPDTEDALVLMGVAAPFVFLSAPRSLAALGAIGSFGFVAAFTWVAVTGSVGRPAVAVPALLALGLLVIEPIVSRLIGIEKPMAASPTVFVLAAQLLVVFLIGRVAAPRGDLIPLIVFTVVAVLTGAALTYVLSARSKPTASP